MVNYITNVSSSGKLSPRSSGISSAFFIETVGFIGLGLGNTLVFQLLAESAEMNKVIKPFIALAPIAFLGNVKAVARDAAVLQPLLQ